MTALLFLLKSYWKPLSGLIVVGILGIVIYYKDVSNCEKAYLAREAKDTIERQNKATEAREKFKPIREKLHEVRKKPNSPELDEYYGKLLSSDPSQT